MEGKEQSCERAVPFCVYVCVCESEGEQERERKGERSRHNAKQRNHCLCVLGWGGGGIVFLCLSLPGQTLVLDIQPTAFPKQIHNPLAVCVCLFVCM